MRNKILISITLLLSTLTFASAQQYSLFEVKKMKEGRATLEKRPFLWIGKAMRNERPKEGSGSESLELGKKKACQLAAIQALSDLQKQAKKQKFIIVKNIHSPNAKLGFFYCDIGGSSVDVTLRGTFSNK